MPTISSFYGITIVMFQKEKEHNPPHLHAIMQDETATFSIRTGELVSGKGFPPKGKRLVKEFILKYQDELLEMWETGEFVRLEPIK